MSTTDTRELNSRATAARLVYQYRSHHEIPSRRLETVTRDRAFVTEMVLGVVRNQHALEWVIDRLTDRAPSETLYPVLLVGLYQLLYMDHVEPYAAVHETVEAAKIICGDAKGGFVNAVLRRALREKEALLRDLEKQPIDIRCSHPKETVARWERQFGRKNAERLCEWNNLRPEMIIRVRGSTDVETLLHEFHSAGVPATQHDRPGFIVLGTFTHIADLPGYDHGWFTVQDPATLLAIDLLDPKPGERILDACAAPGGKAIAIADRMNEQGTLVAADLNPLRLKRLQENLKRCACHFVQTRVIDAATMLPEGFDHSLFDAILLDVPCSNTGVIRRRPEARRRLTSHHLDQLVALQASIIEQACSLLAPGGRIVYSTCSLEPEENEQQIATLLEKRPDLHLVRSARSFPPDDQIDGAYAAELRMKT